MNFVRHDAKLSAGFSLVEFLVALAIIVSLVTTAAAAWQLFFRVSRANTDQTQASLLSEEAAEAFNVLRDNSWTNNIANLSLNTPYYLAWNGSQYVTSASPTVVNSSYLVRAQMSSVSRDANSDIVSNGGTLDNRTRLVDIAILNATSSAVILDSQLLLHDVFHN